jgi:hypothetical protein
LIGCCGAYCKTCKPFLEGFCKGCKLGYEEGKRDLNKAKCQMKVCCFKERKMETCADCLDYPCEILEEFWNKNGWKYKQYKKQLEFIRKNGYEHFIEKANGWKNAYGRLET